MGKISWADTVKLGKYTLKNRIFLSAMTRTRCDPKTGIPNDLLVKYYSQRAGAGLCLTECTSWSQRGVGYPGAGELYNLEQAEGWKKVTDAVHKKKGLLYAQLFHAGRATDTGLNGGLQTWGPSPIPIRAATIFALGGKGYSAPKEMTEDDIKTTLKQFEESVKYAKLANFDGIQLHGANGYIIDQFLRSFSNRRTDNYGGSAQKRIRFALELVDTALKHFEPYQLGIKISPTIRFGDMFDQNPIETYSLLLKELSKRNVGFTEIMESQDSEPGETAKLHIPAKEQIQDICKALRPFFNGLIVANFGFNPESGLKKIEEGTCDLISFARLYITNPDLAQRITNNYPLNTNLDYNTLYGGYLEDKSKGYTDYPAYEGK